MTLPPDIREELERLLAAQTAGELTEAEFEQLAALLRQSPEARSVYVAHRMLEAQLEQEHLPPLKLPAEVPSVGVQPSDSEPKAKNIRPAAKPTRQSAAATWLRELTHEYIRQPLALAILVMAMAFGGLLAWKFSTLPEPIARNPQGTHAPRSSEGETRNRNSSIARLTGMRDANWGEAAWETGSVLHAGQRLSLKQGLAEISFDTGATVILEGPAELVVGEELGVGGRESGEATEIRNSCGLRLGKLTATVPTQAHGFTVHTLSMKITDLGTAFGVEVKARNSSRPSSNQLPATSSTTEVQVFQGEVSITPAAAILAQTPAEKTSTVLKAGDGVVSQSGDGPPRSIKADGSKFVRELPAPAVVATTELSNAPLKPGDILAVSRHTLKLVKIDPKTGEQTLLARGDRGIHGTDWMCVGVDAQRHAVVGTDGPVEGGSRVLRIDPRDGSISVLASGGLLAQGRITALAIAADGMIFATLDEIEDKVLKIDPQTGEVSEVAPFGNNVWGIAIDIQGHDLIAVSDGTGAVARLRGKTVSTWVTGHDTKGARGVAVRPDGRVFVSIYSDPGRKIVEIDRHSHRVTEIATLPPQQDAILGLLAVEPNSNLIVGSYGGQGRVYRIDVPKGTATILSSDGHLEASGGVAVVPGSP